MQEGRKRQKQAYGKGGEQGGKRVDGGEEGWAGGGLEDDCVCLQVDEEEQEVGGGQNVVERVPLQLCEEDAHVERVAEVVEEACGELEDADVQLEVPAVPMHDHQRRDERHVRQDFKAKGERSLRHGHAASTPRLP